MEYHGLEDRIVNDEAQVDKSDRHQYGYAIVQNGKLVKAVDRTNPNKKWDWWVIGGRWQNQLAVSNGNLCDEANVSDIDFEALKEKVLTNKKAAWSAWVKDAEQLPGNNAFLKTHVYGIPAEIETLEQYMALPVKPFSTYAVITPDGQWHASGEMGWFGISSETDEEKAKFRDDYYDLFFKPGLEKKWTVTIVDCHI